jgi:hypothetical protein
VRELEAHRRGDRYDQRMSVSVNGKLAGTDSLANGAWSLLLRALRQILCENRGYRRNV